MHGKGNDRRPAYEFDNGSKIAPSNIRDRQRVVGEGVEMQTFRCLNSSCGEESAVRSIEWYDDQHVVQCQHCSQYHALRQLSNPAGAPIQFEIVGLISD